MKSDFDLNKDISKIILARQEKVYGNPNNRSFIGYINSLTESDILEGRYSVWIKELGLNVRASVSRSLGDTHTNGSGYKPFAPELGTCVRLEYLQESNQMVIIGAMNLAGFGWGTGITLGKKLPDKDTYPLTIPPYTNSLIDLNIKSECVITPLDIRGKSECYDEIVSAGVAVPGITDVKSSTGVEFKILPTAGIKFTPFNVTKVQGVKKTYDEKAAELAVYKSDSYKLKVEESLRRHFQFTNRLIVPTKVLDKAPRIIGSIISNNDSMMSALSEIESILGSIQKLAVMGDQFIQWINQDPALIIEQLLDTFGQFDLDLGVVGIDLNLSLTSIDLNVDFRIGTGNSQLDSVINKVLNTTINTLLDNLLKNFKLGEVLGLDLSALTGGDNVDTEQTYVHNLFTPILRFTNTPRSTSTPNIQSIINSFTSLVRLEESTYLNPSIILTPNSLAPFTDIELLQRYIIQVSGSLKLYNLPVYLEQLYLYKAEKDLIASLAFACNDPEDLLRCVFLYGYYSQSKADCTSLLNNFYKYNRVNKLLDKYAIYSPANYLTLSELVDDLIYDPLDLDLNIFKDTLINPFTKDALEVLISGNFLEYINRCIIIQSKKDLRLEFVDYARLKYLTTRAYPEVHLGYE